ncbi:hypothetical protein [Neorhodopirellula lusitana]|uniref:hypothetical protein n=1 Tax=Neorhodopirellula lusitana TaxID=445327 RepID=UPI0038508BA1
MSNQAFLRRSCSRLLQSIVSKSARRMALAAFIAGSSMLAATADDQEILNRMENGGGISILVHEFQAEPVAAVEPVASANESSQPVAKIAALPAYASLGTHDSVPVAKTATSQFNQAIAAAVFASATKIGISIEQVLEPFAMVGPIANQAPASVPLEVVDGGDIFFAADEAAEVFEELVANEAATEQQLAEAVALNRWWLDTETVAVAKITSTEVAKAEAIPAATRDASDPVSPTTDAADVGLAAHESLELQDEVSSPSDSLLVGSSAMIVTIEDAYLPYDLAKRDLEIQYLPLSSVVPLTPKNYVTYPQETERGFASQVAASAVPEVAATEELDVIPAGMLEDVALGVNALIDQSNVRDFSLTKVGESYGEWIASLAPARVQLAQQIADDSEAADAVAAAKDGEIRVIDGIAMMNVGGEQIPAPIADSIPDANIGRIRMAVSDVDMMFADGSLVPAPVADDLPNAIDSFEQFATMEVAGQSLPAPVADPLVDEPLLVAASEEAADEVNVNELAQRLAALSQAQRQAILTILDAPLVEIASKPESVDQTQQR